MKKFLLVMMAGLMLVSFSACGTSGTIEDGNVPEDVPESVQQVIADFDKNLTGEAGAWEGLEDSSVSNEAREILNAATKGITDEVYEPIALLGTQVVAGTNYCFLCEVIDVDDGEKEYELVYVYVDLEGNATITDTESAEND